MFHNIHIKQVEHSSEHCYQYECLRHSPGLEGYPRGREAKQKVSIIKLDSSHSRIVRGQNDLYMKNASFIHTAFWAWYCSLPDMKIALRWLKHYTTEIFLF